jgi:hypothetical protein
MDLMARKRAESKASVDKEINIIISGLKEAENEKEAYKENEDRKNGGNSISRG